MLFNVLTTIVLLTQPVPEKTIGPHEAQELFYKATDAYQQKEFDTSISMFQSVISAGHESGDIWYNLGNAYFRNSQLAHSIYAYLKAQDLIPRSEDLLTNLSYARSQTIDSLPPREPSSISKVIFFWHYQFSKTELQIAFLIVNIIFFSLLALRLFQKNEILTLIRIISLVVLIALGISLLITYTYPIRWGVISSDQAPVKSALTSSAVTLFKLHNGTEFTIESQEGNWLQIRLSDGKRGWLNKSACIESNQFPWGN